MLIYADGTDYGISFWLIVAMIIDYVSICFVNLAVTDTVVSRNFLFENFSQKKV